jgi:hypothetical protein
MSNTPQHRALLARMEKTLCELSLHLGLIERQIQARAERMTITSRTQRRQSVRGTSRWTRADERHSARTSRHSPSHGASRSTR